MRLIRHQTLASGAGGIQGSTTSWRSPRTHRLLERMIGLPARAGGADE